MNIAYRLTIYSPYPDDTTALTPAAGAPHSDSFIVSTKVGIGKDYIASVRPSPGEAILPDTRWTVGRCNVVLVDKKLGGDNLERWVTAFVGDGEGRIRLIGRRAAVEESLDGGDTWSPLFVGVVTAFALVEPNVYDIQLSEDAERLKFDLFENQLDAFGTLSSVSRFTLLPVGVTTDIGSLKASPRFPASVSTPSDASNARRILTLDTTQTFRQDNVVTESLLALLSNFTGTEPERGTFGEVHVYNSSNEYLGIAVLNDITQAIQGGNYRRRVKEVTISTFRGEGGFPVTSLSNGSSVSFYISSPTPQNDSNGSAPSLSSFILSAPHPLDVLKDLLDSSDISGSALVYEDTNFNSVVSQSITAPPFIGIINEKKEANKFIEEDLLKPYGLAYGYSHKEVAGSPSSVFTVFSIKHPESLDGIPTISDDVVISSEFIDWEPQSPAHFTVNGIVSQVSANRRTSTTTVDDGRGGSEEVDVPEEGVSGLMVSKTLTQVFIDAKASADGVYNDVSISGLGFRSLDDLSAESTNMLGKLKEVGDMYMNRFGKNTGHLTLTCTRTGSIDDLPVGGWVLVNVSWQPDANTYRRGGTRLMQVVHKNPYGVGTQLKLVDSGVTSSLEAPTLGTLSVLSDSNNSINVPITGSSEAAQVSIWYALTPTGSSAPSNGSSTWAYSNSLPLSASEAANVTIPFLPRNRRVYVRARSERPIEGVKLPSSWTVSSALNLNTITSPSSLSVSGSTYYSTQASWTNGGAFYTEVYSTGNEEGTLQLFSVEIPGTTNITLTGLNLAPTTGNIVGVRHIDGNGGVSPLITASFNRGAGTNPAPALDGIFVFDASLFT